MSKEGEKLIAVVEHSSLPFTQPSELINKIQNEMHSAERLSNYLDISSFDSHGFCPNYPLRRHRYESLANAGCQAARADWSRYVVQSDEFGGCNPVNGNFTALVLPSCRPDRIELVAYLLEYAFLHDNVVENVDTSSSTGNDVFTLGDSKTSNHQVEAARKQLQSKIMLQLMSTDNKCAENIMRVWATMLSTTLRDKNKDFENLEEYLDFRRVDTGAPFVEAVMLFGMGMTLSSEEIETLADIVRPCFSSLALANDYFSFDREWQGFQEPGAENPINAVWLYMQWQGTNISEAKTLVRQAANKYEDRFLDLCNEYRESHGPVSPKIDTYLNSLAYQISGNVVWSLNCPRYHPEYRYDPNASLEDEITAEARAERLGLTSYNPDEEGLEGNTCPSVASTGASDPVIDKDNSDTLSLSPATTYSSSFDDELPTTFSLYNSLGSQHLLAPIDYMTTMPSKGVRSKLIDALNLWAKLPDSTVSQIKAIVDQLHNASLVLDDIEDGSSLRRGYPAAHSVFGVPQSINAGSYSIIDAVQKASSLPIDNALEITLDQLKELHIGQSYDLHWTRHRICPSKDSYEEMVAKKTGGLFRLVFQLMSANLDATVQQNLRDLSYQFGIYFQVRDDYLNLCSEEFEDKKGFCEDLDEGKLSYPVIHCLRQENVPPYIYEAFMQKSEEHPMPIATKRLILKTLNENGSLGYTRERLETLSRQISKTTAMVEEKTGQTNWTLRLIAEKLRVK